MFYVFVVIGLLLTGGFTTGVAYFKGYQHAETVYNAESVKRQLAYERGLVQKYKAAAEEADKISFEANERNEKLQKEFNELNNVVQKINELEQRVRCVDEGIVKRLRSIK